MAPLTSATLKPLKELHRYKGRDAGDVVVYLVGHALSLSAIERWKLGVERLQQKSPLPQGED
jgi:hypothetical protein